MPRPLLQHEIDLVFDIRFDLDQEIRTGWTCVAFRYQLRRGCVDTFKGSGLFVWSTEDQRDLRPFFLPAGQALILFHFDNAKNAAVMRSPGWTSCPNVVSLLYRLGILRLGCVISTR